MALLSTLYTAWQQRQKRRQFLRAQHDAYNVYQALFQPVDGFSLSKQAREAQDAIQFVYGEIEYLSFVALLSLAHPNQQTVFYDVGSGIGTAVCACALGFEVKKSCGIEYWPLLHQTAMAQRQRLATWPIASYQRKAETIYCIEGDFLTTAFNEATLIFINASAFFGELWQQLSDKINQECPQAQVITTSKPLLSTNFTVWHTTTVAMSWGVVKAYLHKPITS